MEAGRGRDREPFRRVGYRRGQRRVGSWGRFEDTPLEDVDEMLDVNGRGLLQTVRATLPYLRKRGEGDITLASEAGRRRSRHPFRDGPWPANPDMPERTQMLRSEDVADLVSTRSMAEQSWG
jgi:NAD(P)-dependent dehydrogenase (short-subunit alcohol dehydrogenase family)